MIVSKWSDSLALCIPDSIVEALGLKEGDELDFERIDERSFKIARKPTRKELIEGLRKYRGMMPADFKMSRDEMNER